MTNWTCYECGSYKVFESKLVLIYRLGWAAIFVVWPQSGRIELPPAIQWLLVIGAIIVIWNFRNSWYANRNKR